MKTISKKEGYTRERLANQRRIKGQEILATYKTDSVTLIWLQIGHI